MGCVLHENGKIGENHMKNKKLPCMSEVIAESKEEVSGLGWRKTCQRGFGHVAANVRTDEPLLVEKHERPSWHNC